MKIFKDKKIIFLSIILTIFTISYFIIANKVSYAFSYDYDAQAAYDKLIEIIEQSSIAYGKNNEELFKKDKIIYIKVQDLIDNNLLVPNEAGNLKHPLKENETLNNHIIKIKKSEDKLIAEVDS